MHFLNLSLFFSLNFVSCNIYTLIPEFSLLSTYILIGIGIIGLVLFYNPLFIFYRELGYSNRYNLDRLKRNRRTNNIVDIDYIRGRLPYHSEDTILFFDRVNSDPIMLQRIMYELKLRKIRLNIEGEVRTYLTLTDLTPGHFIEEIDGVNGIFIKKLDIDSARYLTDKILVFNRNKLLNMEISSKESVHILGQGNSGNITPGQICS